MVKKALPSPDPCHLNIKGLVVRLFHIMLKNYLLCYSPKLLNVAYYTIDSYPLFLYKKKFMLSEFTVLVHRPFSSTIQ